MPATAVANEAAVDPRCIAGIEAIWAVDARARIAMVEPLIHVVAPRSRPDLADAAAAYQNSQYEACDMLSGTVAPDRRPIFVAETSHVWSGRIESLRELTDELTAAIAAGIPLEGVRRRGVDSPATLARSGLRSNAAAFRP